MNDLNNSIKVDASIGSNFFAPKCVDRDTKFDVRNAHAIANSNCNFKCSFCKHGVNNKVKPHYIEIEKFQEQIVELIKMGTMFKFTGGEPCLNPYLERMLKIVKEN